MKTYVINLPDATIRKAHVECLLGEYPFLDLEFVDAVYGKKMSDSELHENFDYEKFVTRYGRLPKCGEIGCTLSHQKCYRSIVDNDDDFAIIFEDDLSGVKECSFILQSLEKYMRKQTKPLIILLSGGYWFYPLKGYRENSLKMVSIFDAYYTHSYIINKQAAMIMQKEKSFLLADDWRFAISQKNVTVLALYPHIFGQVTDLSFASSISTEDRGVVKRNLKIRRLLNVYYVGVVKKILRLMHCYEKA